MPDADHCRVRLEPDRHDALHHELDDWRANVGSPIAIDAGPCAPERITGIDILCWNVAIGLGQLSVLLERLRTGMPGFGTQADRPLIILLQEVFRDDDTVPGHSTSRYHGGALAVRSRTNIIELAEQNALSLRYSPSMRNGAHASDRGNAVLSTTRLEAAHAFLLPYVRQRRVAVSARLAGHPDFTFVSAHLDTHGRPRLEPAGRSVGAGRAVQARALATAVDTIPGNVVVGGDLNSVLGMTDPAVRALIEAGMHPARRVGRWRHTLHRPFRLLLDHVLFRSPGGRITHAEVVRVDEVQGDRSPTVFGSDHHPLLARIELRDH